MSGAGGGRADPPPLQAAGGRGGPLRACSPSWILLLMGGDCTPAACRRCTGRSRRYESMNRSPGPSCPGPWPPLPPSPPPAVRCAKSPCPAGRPSAGDHTFLWVGEDALLVTCRPAGLRCSRGRGYPGGKDQDEHQARQLMGLLRAACLAQFFQAAAASSQHPDSPLPPHIAPQDVPVLCLPPDPRLSQPASSCCSQLDSPAPPAFWGPICGRHVWQAGLWAAAGGCTVPGRQPAYVQREGGGPMRRRRRRRSWGRAQRVSSAAAAIVCFP